MLGYRLHREACYRPSTNQSGQYTHAWELVCDVKSFIAREVTQEKCYGVYLAYTSSGSYSLNSRLAEFLCIGSVQSRFPRLEPNRHLLIFQNGIFQTKNLFFYAFGEEEQWDEGTEFALDRLREARTRVLATPPQPTPTHPATPPSHHLTLATQVDPNAESYVRTPTRGDANLKIFPYDLPDEMIELINGSAKIADMRASDISTPKLDSILNYQQLTPETKRIVFAMLGRLFFDVGCFDKFHVGLVFKGVAGCGKSSIIQLIASCFDKDTISVLGANMQSNFGWEGTENADLAAVYELSKNMFVGEGQKILQSALSGEDVPITRKGKTTMTIQFRAPFIMVGNELPNWSDNSNSMARRILLILFLFMVTTQNEHLGKELEDERPFSLPKMIILYRQLAIEAEGCGFWPRASQQVRQWKDELMSETQPLVAFLLRSGRFVMAHGSDGARNPADTFIPETVFLDMFRSYCRETNTPMPQWNRDLYHTTFAQYAIERRYASVVWDGDGLSEHVLFGVTTR